MAYMIHKEYQHIKDLEKENKELRDLVIHLNNEIVDKNKEISNLLTKLRIQKEA